MYICLRLTMSEYGIEDGSTNILDTSRFPILQPVNYEDFVLL